MAFGIGNGNRVNYLAVNEIRKKDKPSLGKKA